MEVSRSRIVANYNAIRTVVGSAAVMGVVKADAYGHGMAEVADILEGAGIRWLAVSSVSEGVALREAGSRARILIMAGFLPDECEALTAYDLTPAIHSLDDARVLAESAPHRPWHLKVDTGLARLGVRNGLEGVLAALPRPPEGLMTHLASPSDLGSLQTVHQLEAFAQATQRCEAMGIRPPWRHTASTNAIAYPRSPEWRRAAWHNLVRPGHALYGYVSPARPAPAAPVLRVAPALQWKARILAVKDIPEGAPVGYGATFHASHPMRLGVVAAGYADGLPHQLSNRGRMIAGDRLVPIVGTVSMDLTTIDLTAVPQVGVGDAVMILGDNGGVALDAQQVARLAGTISYDLLCGIGPRVKRIYVD